MSITYGSIIEEHFRVNADYEEDILINLLEDEKNLPITSNFIETVQKNKITLDMRTTLIRWMQDWATRMKMDFTSKQTAVMIVDMVLSKQVIHQNFLQLLGVASLLITSKFNEGLGIQLEDCSKMCQNFYSAAQIAEMEQLILNTLKWKVNVPLPSEIAKRLLHFYNKTLELDLPKVFTTVDKLVNILITEFDFSYFSPSTFGAAAVFYYLQEDSKKSDFWRQICENLNILNQDSIDFLVDHINQRYEKAEQQSPTPKSSQASGKNRSQNPSQSQKNSQELAATQLCQQQHQSQTSSADVNDRIISEDYDFPQSEMKDEETKSESQQSFTNLYQPLNDLQIQSASPSSLHGSIYLECDSQINSPYDSRGGCSAILLNSMNQINLKSKYSPDLSPAASQSSRTKQIVKKKAISLSRKNSDVGKGKQSLKKR